SASGFIVEKSAIGYRGVKIIGLIRRSSDEESAAETVCAPEAVDTIAAGGCAAGSAVPTDAEVIRECAIGNDCGANIVCVRAIDSAAQAHATGTPGTGATSGITGATGTAGAGVTACGTVANHRAVTEGEHP